MWEYKRFQNSQFIIQIKNEMAGLQNHFNKSVKDQERRGLISSKVGQIFYLK